MKDLGFLSLIDDTSWTAFDCFWFDINPIDELTDKILSYGRLFVI